MKYKLSLIILLCMISFTCFSCDHDEFFIEDDIINLNDSIFHGSEKSSNNDTISGNTTKTDTTHINNNSLQENNSYNIDNLFTKNDNDTLIYVSEITKYMRQYSGGQGAACYEDYLFHFQDHNAAVSIYNLAEMGFIKKIVLTPNSNNHCNQASFSNIFYSVEDKFPLLYVSGSRTGTYNQVQVYRITDDSDSLKIEQIQEIILPPKTKYNYISWTCILLDNDSNYLYAYSNATSKLIKFNIPNYQERTVNLEDEDILEIIPIENIPHQQGGTIKNGIFYMIYGVPQWGDQVWLRLFNLETKKEIIRYNLSEKDFKGEPESLFFYKNELYAITNGTGIFKIIFQKSFLQTQ